MKNSKSVSQALKVSPTLTQAMLEDTMSAAKMAKAEGMSKQDFETMVGTVVSQVWEDNDGSGSEAEPVQDSEEQP